MKKCFGQSLHRWYLVDLVERELFLQGDIYAKVFVVLICADAIQVIFPIALRI